MDDAFLMSSIEGVANLFRIFQRRIEWKRAFERSFLDILHYQIIGWPKLACAEGGVLDSVDRPIVTSPKTRS